MTIHSDTAHKRHELRAQLRTARSQLDSSAAHEYSLSIAEKLYPLLHGAEQVAGYLAVGNEVNVSGVLSRCQRDGIDTWLPVVAADHKMLFVAFHSSTPLVANRFNILEPVTENAATCNPTSLDAVIVPLVGFDLSCNRMGMGGGYYDRAFASRRNTPSDESTCQTNKPVLIGVAYDLQRVDTVFPDWWDVPLDFVVTPSQVLSKAQERAHAPNA